MFASGLLTKGGQAQMFVGAATADYCPQHQPCEQAK
jgi:hypothetical protein